MGARLMRWPLGPAPQTLKRKTMSISVLTLLIVAGAGVYWYQYDKNLKLLDRASEIRMAMWSRSAQLKRDGDEESGEALAEMSDLLFSAISCVYAKKMSCSAEQANKIMTLFRLMNRDFIAEAIGTRIPHVLTQASEAVAHVSAEFYKLAKKAGVQA